MFFKQKWNQIEFKDIIKNRIERIIFNKTLQFYYHTP
jgi:hypothetical protein